MKDVLRMNEMNNAEPCKARLMEPGSFPEILLEETDLNGVRAFYVMSNAIGSREVMWNQGANDAQLRKNVLGSRTSHNKNVRAAGKESEETKDWFMPEFYRAG